MSLYDPKEFPEAPTVSPDFTVADVLAWAKTKPADETYDYYDNGNCALCQFLRESGICLAPNVDGFAWRGPDGVSRDIDDGLSHALHDDRDDRTITAIPFGALAKRLEALS